MQTPEIAELRAQLAAQAARLAAQEAASATLRAQLAALRPGRGARRGLARLAGLPLVLLLILLPCGVLAASFVDLNPGSPHNGNIDAIADAGISKGCIDAQHYCPNANVTREEMASFLARTAGLGGNPPVTNAATLQGYAPAALLRAAFAKGPDVLDPVKLDGSNQSLASVTLQAPGPGIVLVSGAVTVSADATCPCRVDIRLRDASTNTNAPTLLANIGLTPGAAYQQSISPVWAFPVAGTGSHTYRLEGRRASGNGLPTAANGAITALFVPFGPDGGIGLGQP